MKRISIGVLIVLITVGIVAQNPKSADSDWPMYSRDHAGSRYSPLQQINTENVAQLTQAWCTVRTAQFARGRAPVASRRVGPGPANQ
jgi:glucose dehydrogenase